MWSKLNDSTITFECDSIECTEAVDCDVKVIRESSGPAPHASDFSVCWRHLQNSGWRSFRRIGKPWTYHCPTCGPEAEKTHHEHQQSDSARDEIRARNRGG